MTSRKKKFYENGIRFKCQGSSKCCQFRGAYGYVYLSIEERRRLASYFRIPTRTFTIKYTEKTDGLFHLKQIKKNCPFLDNKRCTVYKARPNQCRTWPFWPENMNPIVWEKEIKACCPGIDKGKLYSAAEIEKILHKKT